MSRRCSVLELTFYYLCLVACATLWIAAIGSSLWLDETLSFWQIHGGFSQILKRQWMTFPAYSYLLWIDMKVLGTSEIALRVPSLLAMLASARLVYATCMEALSDSRSAYVGLIFFAAHPFVVFAAIDVRPYGFAVLATALAVYGAVKFRGTASVHRGILFGCACGLIVWFHFLFAVILPGLFAYFIRPLRIRNAIGWCPVLAAAGAFILMVIPALPEIVYTFTTRQTHVISEAPGLFNLANLAFPSFLLMALPLMIVPAEWLWLARKELGHSIYLAFIAGLLPALVLFLVSTVSSIHVFLSRYTLVAVPGLAIGWALLARSSPFSWGRYLLISLLLGLGIAPQLLHGPAYDRKYGDLRAGIEFADARAQAIGGPIVLCSQFVESNADGTSMPAEPKDSKLFSPLSYYPVRADVVPLPQLLNGRTVELGSRFLEAAAVQRQPFVVVGAAASRPVVDWFAQNAHGFKVQTHEVGEIYVVAEFTPDSAHP